MPPAANIVAFVSTSIVFFLVPGPSAFYVMGRALVGGRRLGLLSVAGNALGIVPAVVLVAVGVGPLVARSVALLMGVKLAGAVFIAYLGVEAWRHRHSEMFPAADAMELPTWRILTAGVTVGVTNPKAVVVLVAVLPQFVAPHQGHVPLQLLILGALSIALGTAADATWALSANALRGLVSRSSRNATMIEGGGGVVMVGLGGYLAVEALR